MTEDLCYLSTLELGTLLRRREVSTVEIVQATLERIQHPRTVRERPALEGVGPGQLQEDRHLLEDRGDGLLVQGVLGQRTELRKKGHYGRAPAILPVRTTTRKR